MSAGHVHIVRNSTILPGVFAVAALLASPVLAETPARLVAVERIASNALDSHGETLGGFGSGLALVPGSWRRQGDHFVGSLAAIPDRGWNTEGTSDYQARVQFFDIVLTPQDGAPQAQTGLELRYRRSLLLSDKRGIPTTGIDPRETRAAAGGLPDLPLAPNGRVSLDSEAVALSGDNTVWTSDEYGPYIYHFDARGRMLAAIRPPEAFIARRDGQASFSANSPPRGEKYDVGTPKSGRQDNQGFEGMSLTPDHKHLFAITQSALVQDMDPSATKTTRRNARLLEYDVGSKLPQLIHEYVVELPLWSDGKTDTLVAAQSEMLALNTHQLLLLCRDSGGGFTGKRDASNFRRVMLLELAGASDVKGHYDKADEAIAPKGILRSEIIPARLSSLLDINDNAQLARFGLHNGAPSDRNDLYEKWEGMALASAHDPKAPDDYFLFVGSDNDFITQDGVMAGQPFRDISGNNVDSLVLVYRLSLRP